MKRVAIWMVAGMMAVAAAGETVPEGIAYQGLLIDPVEGALEGGQKVTFRVFRDQTGGSALWSKDLDLRCGPNGLIHAWLSGAGLADAFSETNRFLEVQVDGRGAPIPPRVAFTSVPQVLLARRARQAPLTFTVTGNLSVGDALSVADCAQFDEGAEFHDLSVAGAAAWQDRNQVVRATGNVTAGRFEGDGIAPVGSIVMWEDSQNIPEGWALCDGQDGRPDLRNRFTVGVGGSENYSLGQTGGSNAVALTVKQIPPHTHSYTTAGNREFNLYCNWEKSDWWKSSRHGKPQQGSTDPAGNGLEHENRPPFYALCFIIRVR
ncbi:MAG: hypothetical protein IK066_12630 [Kiritimatiellae bacterium]|nr:hypothetical protein [Kiritimatiellia bacterium]